MGPNEINSLRCTGHTTLHSAATYKNNHQSDKNSARLTDKRDPRKRYTHFFAGRFAGEIN